MDFLDALGQYGQRRFDQATQPFTDPSGYLNNRLGIEGETEADINGNVKPISTTINYGENGKHTVTTKHEVAPVAPPVTAEAPIAAPQPAVAQTPVPVPQPAVAAGPQVARPIPAVGPVGAVAPENMMPMSGSPVGTPANARPIRSDSGDIVGYETPQQMMEGAQTNAPVAPAPQPAVLTAPTATQPPSVQPVNPAQPALTPTGATTAPGATAPTQPAQQLQTWQQNLLDAKNDPRLLESYIANSDNPEEGKTIARQLLKQQYKQEEETANTDKMLKDFVSGDRKAQTDVMKRLTSKTEEGSYLKAYLFNRFGLHDLAQQEQKKLAGTNFDRMMIDGKNYLVEMNQQGGITGAYDNAGKAVGEDTLAKLNAGAMKTGSHAFTSTGDIHITPDNKQVIKRFNSMTGTPEWIDIKSGERWAGQGNPVPQSISTAIAKKEGTENVVLNYAGALSATRAGAGSIGKFNAENGTNLAIPSYGPNRGRLVDMNAGGQVVTPDTSGNFSPVKNNATGAPVGELFKLPNGARVTAEQKQLADQGIPIFSGHRSQAENEALKDHQINGQWFTKEGRPVSDSTIHADGRGMDVESKKLTPEGRKLLESNGWTNTGLKYNDPDHWEKIGATTAAGAQGRVSPAATTKVAPAPIFREAGFENESPADFKVRRENAAKAEAPIVKSEAAKQYAAQNVYPVVKDVNDALKKATGSGIGAKVDDLAAFFGHSTEGAQNIAKLQVLGDTLLKSVPRFEGPQSDRDVASYYAAAGKLADPNVPIATRSAAFKTIIDLNKKYAPDLDWSFNEGKKTGSVAPTGTTKVIGGVTYVNDGKGWKVQR